MRHLVVRSAAADTPCDEQFMSVTRMPSLSALLQSGGLVNGQLLPVLGACTGILGSWYHRGSGEGGDLDQGLIHSRFSGEKACGEGFTDSQSGHAWPPR